MNDSLLDHALRYAELGYGVFPCAPGRKDPACAHGCLDATTAPEQIENWWTVNPKYNIGLATIGLCVLDVDGANNPFLSQVPPDDLLRCPLVTTPRGGRHFYFRQNGVALRCTKGEIADHVDTRADGGYVVAPPSIVNGRRYEWVEDVVRPDLLPVVPAWLVAGLVKPDGQPADKKPLAEIAGEDIPEGKRNATLYRFGCAMRGYGFDADEINQALQVRNAAKCKPPMDEAEVRKIAESAAKQTPTESKTALVAPEQPNIGGIVGQKNGQPAAAQGMTLATRSYDTIKIEPVDWFWKHRFGFGKYSLIAGVPGVGKTFAVCDLVSRASKGLAFPDGSPCTLCESLIVTAEDAPEDTIAPRLLAHGCDMTKVHHLDVVKIGSAEKFFCMGDSIAALDKWLTDHPRVRLVTLDPITAFAGDDIDSHHGAEVRARLVPIVKCVEKHKASLVGVSHLSKGQSKAINRILGSIAWVAAARAVWLIDWDPETEGRRLFLQVKNNLSHADGLAYSVQDGRVVWEEGAITITADELSDPNYSTPRDEAVSWLRQMLRDGPVSSSEIATAAKHEGIAERTLKRAKRQLKVTSKREGNRWVFTLPEHGVDVSGVVDQA